MSSYTVICNEDATPEQIQSVKMHAINEGGKIGHEFKIIKGFSVTLPEDSISTLENHEFVKSVESDDALMAS